MDGKCRICGRDLNEGYVDESNHYDYLCLKCGRLKMIIKEAFREILSERR